MTGVFLDVATVQRGDLDLSGLTATLPRWQFHDYTEASQLIERLSGATVAVSNKVYLGAETLRQLSQLKLICVAATGTNNIDLEAARQCGIVVSNVRHYATPSVVQHVFALMLALTTRMDNYRQLIRDGAWQRARSFSLLDFEISEIAGKTLGIVGYGALGQGVARVAEAFGMRVLIAARAGQPVHAPRVALHDLLPQVDVLSLHCPLTNETRGMMGVRELALMKSTALLINTARGGLVDEMALVDALRAQRLGGAGFDVLSEEPPVCGNPLLASDVPNLILTPHIAWASRESRQRLMNEVAENIRAFTWGTPRNRVA